VSLYDEEGYGYKVDLEDFSGPLDLLLYLIRQDEVEITNIPIARITDQYLQHLDLIQQINMNVAGEFILMAATLMEIKSRMILPRPEREGEEEPEDPRSDLIRQLIEYKKFKDAARSLAARADEQARKFPRGAAAVLGLPDRPANEELPLELGEISVWDLMAAFKVILSQTTLDSTRHVVLGEKPATAHCNDLLDELRTRGSATLRELLDPAAGRLALLHAFVALLELIRRRRVRAEQGAEHGEIRLVLLDDTPVSEYEIAQPTPPPPEPEAAAAAPTDQAAAPSAQPTSTPAVPGSDDSDEGTTPDTEVEDIVVPEIAPLPEITEGALELDEPGDTTEAAPLPAAAPAPVEPTPLPAPSRPKRKRRPKPASAKQCALFLLRRARRPICLLARLLPRRGVPSPAPVAVILRPRTPLFPSPIGRG